MPSTSRLMPLLGLLLAVGISTAIASEEDQQVRLNEGFKNNDLTPLDQYLEAWRKKRGPVSESTLAKKPEVEREAYAIFQVFFIPAKVSVNAKYAIVQDELRVTLVDDDLGGVFAKKGEYLHSDAGLSTPEERLKKLPVISRLTLQDFRPAVSREIPKVLYLSQPFLGEMLEFIVGEWKSESLYTELTERYWDVAHGNDPEDVKDATLMGRRSRLQYLNSKLNILPGHFGTGWHFETHPSIGRLYLSCDYRRAVVTFREGYGGGEAYIQKDGKDAWKVILRDDNFTE